MENKRVQEGLNMEEDQRVEPYLTKNEEAKRTLIDSMALYNKGEYDQANMMCKAVAFDALFDHDFDLLRHAYRYLAEYADKEEVEFRYIQGALLAAEFSGPLYVRTCLSTIFNMQTMDSQKVLRLIPILMGIVHNTEFMAFLIALHARLTNQDYTTLNLPDSLVLELVKFRNTERKPPKVGLQW